MGIENLVELRLVVACADGQNLTAVAHTLGLTPAATSAMLARIERRLGARLFERSTRSMQPTQAGTALAEHGRRALDLVDEGVSLATDADAALRGGIVVTAPSDLARHDLVRTIDSFLAQHPGVEVTLLAGDSMRDVRRERIDVALRYGALRDSELVAKKLVDVRRLAVASPAYLAARGRPKTPAELTEHECLVYNANGAPHAEWRFFRRDGTHVSTVRVRGRRVSNDAEISRRWAVAGHGITYKSALDLREDLAEGRLVPVFSQLVGESATIHAVLPSGRFVPRRVRAFVEHVRVTLAGLMQGKTSRRAKR